MKGIVLAKQLSSDLLIWSQKCVIEHCVGYYV